MSIKKIFRQLLSANQKIVKVIKHSLVNYKLRKSGFKNTNKIPTFTSKEELLKLHELAVSCPTKANVVEIGSYLGASTCYIAAGLNGKNASLYCIDTWQNETMPDGIKDTFNSFLKNIAKSKTKIFKIRQNSLNVKNRDLPLSVDFAFIDGDHSFASVKKDVGLIELLMSKDSILAFHDAVYFKGVSMMIGEVLKGGNWRLEGQVNNLVWLRKYQFKQ
jgi:predicted O-methyltransferase YrrM